MNVEKLLRLTNILKPTCFQFSLFTTSKQGKQPKKSNLA